MKKNFLFLLIGLLLAVPVAASAGIIENVILNEGYRSGYDGRFTFPNLGTSTVYDNYTATISGGSTITNGTYESFCVEDAWTSGSNNDYTVLSIDSSLDSYGLNTDDFFRASWIAETYYDKDKEAAQIAIWEIMFDDVANIYAGGFRYVSGVSDGTLANATDYLTAANALTYNSNFSSNWVLAVNPTVAAGGTISLASSQNYIFRASEHAPEPSTILLLGIGLIGAAGFGRKRFIK